MPSNKDRLYVALYARGGAPTMPGGEDRYHWAFIVGPKVESVDSPGLRIHAKEKPDPTGSKWEYEARDVHMGSTAMILVRILIGKIEDKQRMLTILSQEVPIRQGVPGWNCVEWIKEALQKLAEDKKALGTSVTDWKTIRGTAMWYVAQKKEQHRFDGQAKPGEFDAERVATFDLLAGRQTIP